MKYTIAAALFALAAAPAPAQSTPKGILLERLTWVEAGKVLGPGAVVVIALGAQSKEHGPHLQLRNDWLMAEYLKDRVLRASNVVVAPTINYSFYPAFVDYPGSTNLRMNTARDMVVDIVRSLARHGPRRFYIVNTGVSTRRPLSAAADTLAAEGILMRFTNVLTIAEDVVTQVSRQEGGTHADEIETSMMLYIAPGTVDMRKAAKDYRPSATPGPLSRDSTAAGTTYSPTGIVGDATLATRAKGRAVTEAMVERVLKEIEALRATTLPAGAAR